MADHPRIGRPLFRLEVQSAQAHQPERSREGWVYLAGAGQGLVKAGRARNAPRGAARDWKPDVIAYAKVEDRYAAEANLLLRLSPFRVVGTKLYRLPAQQGVALLRDQCGEVVVVPPRER